ncbi:MAG: GNAT family N-acetyltransferase [Candidatus Lokiarchaeota archaeon]|nr:GNAT family N-acetyltransferase [Candidatus Lokiarchaeota archaeon]
MTEFNGENVTLKDGLEVLIRPIQNDDGQKLVEMFNYLSEETKYTRFMKFRKSIDEEELEPFLTADKKNFAIVAEIEPDDEDKESFIIADGRYVLDEPPDKASVAIIVQDDYQRQGLATHMLSILIDIAKENGIKYFHGEILLENSKMLNFIKRTGYQYSYHDQKGVRYFNIDLEQIKTPL